MNSVIDSFAGQGLTRFEIGKDIATRAYLRTRAGESQNWKCCFCGVKADGATVKTVATLEHFVPKSEGGKDEYDNAVMSCLKCNNQRGILDAVAFVPNQPSKTSLERQAQRESRQAYRMRRALKKAVRMKESNWKSICGRINCFDDWLNTLHNITATDRAQLIILYGETQNVSR